MWIYCKCHLFLWCQICISSIITPVFSVTWSSDYFHFWLLSKLENCCAASYVCENLDTFLTSTKFKQFEEHIFTSGPTEHKVHRNEHQLWLFVLQSSMSDQSLCKKPCFYCISEMSQLISLLVWTFSFYFKSKLNEQHMKKTFMLIAHDNFVNTSERHLSSRFITLQSQKLISMIL